MGFSGVNWGNLGSGQSSSQTASNTSTPYVPGSRQFPFDVPEAFNVPYAGQPTGPVRSLTDDIQQIDVRTKNMRALEEAALPMLFQALLNPRAVASQFGQMAGQVPGAAAQPGTTATVLDTTQDQQQAAGLLAQLFNGAGAGGASLPGLPPQPAGPGGVIPNPPPLNRPPVNQQPATEPGRPPITGPNPQSPQNPSGAADPNWTGSTVGGQPIGGSTPPAPAPVAGLPAEFAAFLSRFGGNMNGAMNDIPALQQLFGLQGQPVLSGLVPGTGAPGQEFNLGALNEQLLPQGYLAQAGGNGTPWGVYKAKGYEQGGNWNHTALQSGVPELQSFLQQLGVQFRAGGGPLDPNALTIVGEKGPELIAPAPGGGQQVIPNLLGGGLQPLQQPGGFQSTPMQGPGTGPSMRLSEQNPEMETFELGKSILGGQQNPGQGVMQALQPVFNQNLQQGLGQLRSAAPSVFGTGFAGQGVDLTSRALNDFNLLAAQALQQGVSQQQQGLGILGQLAGQAGNNGFNRNLATAQFGEQQKLNTAQTGLMGAQAGDITGRLGIAQGNAPFERALMDRQAGLLNSQIYASDSMIPFQQALADRQANLLNQQGSALQAETGLAQQRFGLEQQLGLGQLGMQQSLLPYQQNLLGAQTQDIGAARQQAGQQIGQQYNLGLGSLANEQLLGLRGQDIQRQLGLSQLGQQQQQFQSNYGLAAQQQQYNQTVNPTLQLLLAALGMAQPTAYQSVVRQNS